LLPELFVIPPITRHQPPNVLLEEICCIRLVQTTNAPKLYKTEKIAGNEKLSNFDQKIDSVAQNMAEFLHTVKRGSNKIQTKSVFHFLVVTGGEIFPLLSDSLSGGKIAALLEREHQSFPCHGVLEGSTLWS
jgi:hypothetical protein